MVTSAFVNRGGSRPGSGTGNPRGATMEFTMMVVREHGKPAGLAGLTNARAVHGLLKWGAETYEASTFRIGLVTLREGTYLVDGGPRRPTSGGGKGERAGVAAGAGAKPAGGGPGFSIPLLKQGEGDHGLSLHGPALARQEPGIALMQADAAEFWQRWNAAGRERPAWLRVIHAVATTDGGKNPAGGDGGGEDGKNPFGGGGGGGSGSGGGGGGGGSGGGKNPGGRRPPFRPLG